MNRFVVFVVAALAALAGSAQSKINPGGLRMLSVAEGSRAEADRGVLGFVTLAEGADATEIDGVRTVYGVENGVALVEFALGDAPRIAAQEAVARLTFGNELRPLLDKARVESAANLVQSGGPQNELGAKYDGTGVVLGLVDHGIDPNNVNFMNQATGESRVKRVWRLDVDDDYKASALEYSTPEGIARFTTDVSEATHGTHVAGIMGGSYSGPGKVTRNSGGKIEAVDGSVNYYGVAPGADLAMCGGSLAEPAVMLGVQKIVDYAASVSKPAVVNLSLGTTMGPHDGTDAFSQYLAGLGRKSIICISAGNEGESNVSLQHTFGGELKTFLSGYSGNAGVVDAWGDDSTPFDVEFVIFDTSSGKKVYSKKMTGKATGALAVIATDNYTNQGWEHDAQFSTAFEDSYVQIYTELCQDNGRFNIYIYYDLTNKSTNKTLVPGVIYTGKSGTKINVWDFCSGGEFTSNGVAGWSTGNPSESINGMACGQNIIVVGSYVSRDKWPVLGGYALWYGQEYADAHPVGTVSPFTSYGTTFQGRKLPDLCAPGEAVVSSYSTYYVDVEGTSEDEMSAMATSTVNGKERKNYWHALQGTSMASPYVAGVAALLLQAKPDLTVAEVKSLLTGTAYAEKGRTPAEVMQWGAGKANAFLAMCQLLGKTTAISALNADTKARLKVELSGDVLTVELAGEEFTATLYDLNGRAVGSGGRTPHATSLHGGDGRTPHATSLHGGDGRTPHATSLQVGGLPRGVYVVVARSVSGTVVTEKVILK